ncbi:Colicin V production protein [Desulfofarcimen acetoxidans DSM 771]|uniref:Colicin V production protein n=1 Tax=Desulfofarcimen acetoxidans (strain ATCC 49208 / DSM 771 / KCTC 5769 / VKM B-1644 / 5575) TaxID=485916 RepID=C8W053_DESAS|nr:CvpA family protein [Desulfofarcimen acetoxidans]ACV65021.1 Colicin V production protein [Desulfofarcimen acetoxidans DSM 771]
MNWLDIIFIIIIIYSAMIGFFTGLIKSLTKLISIIGGLFAAYKYYGELVAYINSVWHCEKIITSWITNWLKSKYVPFYKGDIPAISELSGMLAVHILELTCFLFVFLAAYMIIKILGSFLSGITSLVFLKPVDRLMGSLVGIIKGTAVVLIFILVMTHLQLYADVFLGNEKLSYYLDQSINNSIMIPYGEKLLGMLKNFFGFTFNYYKNDQYMDMIKIIQLIKNQ